MRRIAFAGSIAVGFFSGLARLFRFDVVLRDELREVDSRVESSLGATILTMAPVAIGLKHDLGLRGDRAVAAASRISKGRNYQDSNPRA